MTDFLFHDCGSIVRIVPQSPYALTWLRENVAFDPWQWFGCSLCCDSRAGYALLSVIEDADECFEIEEQ